jgi:hypothetical protein
LFFSGTFTAQMLTFNVNYFNTSHEALLKSTPLGSTLDRLVLEDWKCDEEVFLAYSMFVHQKKGRDGWKTYSDLKSKLPRFRDGLLSYFSINNGSVTALFSGRNESRSDHTESIGVGCALGCLSAAIGLTDADWERINVSTVKDLDFKIASDGTNYIAIEARGRIRDSPGTEGLSETANEIAEKKLTQRDLTAASEVGAYPISATLVGVIAAIPYQADTTANVWLLDPPPVGINVDPQKYQLLSRLTFYHRMLGMICGRANFLTALSNHIRGVEIAENYRNFDDLPLLNGTRGEINFPDSILSSRTVTEDLRIVGEVIPLEGRRAYFFGIEVEVIRTMLRPIFASVITFRTKSAMNNEPTRLTVRIRGNELEQFPPVPEDARLPGVLNRVEFEGKGFLSTTPGGVVLGEVFW